MIAKHFEKKNIKKKYCNNEDDEAEAVGKAEEMQSGVSKISQEKPQQQSQINLSAC